ncbi:MAG: hypothetical protein WBA54_06665, partial [Acidaminobacteraceae bacterium]
VSAILITIPTAIMGLATACAIVLSLFFALIDKLVISNVSEDKDEYTKIEIIKLHKGIYL